MSCDLVDAVTRAGVPLMQVQADTWTGVCPFHEESTPSFHVYGADGVAGWFVCFGCGETGNVDDFLHSLALTDPQELEPAPRNETERWCQEHLNPRSGPSPVSLPGDGEKFNRRMLPKIFKELGFTSGVEVGVASGQHALTLCECIPGLRLLCVDPFSPFDDNPRDRTSEEHLRNKHQAWDRLETKYVEWWETTSMEAVRDVPLGSLDFCYIDAHHGFDYVMQDIIEWGRRVRVGGIVAGHDYCRAQWSGVVDAVDAYVGAHHVREWFVTREAEPEWFFVKSGWHGN